MPTTEKILQAKSQALDDTDPYASVWKSILDSAAGANDATTFTDNSTGRRRLQYLWGGRGRGGRGLSRRTVQPTTIVVDDIRLQYLQQDGVGSNSTQQNCGNGGGGLGSSQRMLLDGAVLKLLHGHKYVLIGRNGSGKTTLLQRIQDQMLPGWSIQWSSLYVPPCLSPEDQLLTPTQLFRTRLDECHRRSRSAIESKMKELEAQLDGIDIEKDPEAAERLCEQISRLEDQLEPADNEQVNIFHRMVEDDLRIDTEQPCMLLSVEQQKEVMLIAATVCSQYTTLLLLDEPTSFLSIPGLLRLRQLLETVTCTVVMITHDLDLINDVATDIIELRGLKLSYFPGNYDSYRLMKEQMETHQMKQALAVEKKRDQLRNTLQNIKEKPAPKRGGAKKKAKAVASHRKKMEWHEKDASEVSTSTCDVLLPDRKGLTATERIRLAQILRSVPDKAVQFVFPSTPSQWAEPLVVAYDVGYRLFNWQNVESGAHSFAGKSSVIDQTKEVAAFEVVKRDGFCFDCVDLCIEEGSMNCILGPAEMSSHLLKILAKRLSPTEGTVHHASGTSLGYIDSGVIENLKRDLDSTRTTAFDFLVSMCTEKSQEELRAHLTSFGMSSISQTKTPLVCLSGGEIFRFVLALEMMSKPPLLFLDSPTSHLDVESVNALAHGLKQWNGTVIMVCHDACFMRSLDEVKCVVIIPEEGKVRRIINEEGIGSMDSYLNSFQTKK